MAEFQGAEGERDLAGRVELLRLELFHRRTAKQYLRSELVAARMEQVLKVFSPQGKWQEGIKVEVRSPGPNRLELIATAENPADRPLTQWLLHGTKEHMIFPRVKKALFGTDRWPVDFRTGQPRPLPWVHHPGAEPALDEALDSSLDEALSIINNEFGKDYRDRVEAIYNGKQVPQDH